LDEANGALDQAKIEFKGKLDGERKRFAERLDKMKLELTEAQLSADELRVEVKRWREKYEVLREGME
jgi:hypothetical protein